MRTYSIALLVLTMISACGSPPEVVKKPTPSPTQAPTPAGAETVDKPTNVSFSTYSKEWPVNWQFIDPDANYKATDYSVKSGVLRMKVPTQRDLYGENRTAPRYVKALKGDFQIETRVRFLPKENYQGAGLLIFRDDNNYMRFERAFGGVGGGGEGIRIDVRKGDEYTPLVTPDDLQTTARDVDLKIVRSGRIFTAYWRENEDSEWREAGEFESDYPDTVLAGVMVCNTAREVVAEFAYIRLAPGLQSDKLP